MDHRSGDKHHEQGWRACPRGELTRLGQRLRGRQRRRRFLQVGSVAAGLLALGGGALWLWLAGDSSNEHDFGGITCSKVQELRDDYRRQRIDQDTRNRIDTHLSQCHLCAKAYRQSHTHQPGSHT